MKHLFILWCLVASAWGAVIWAQTTEPKPCALEYEKFKIQAALIAQSREQTELRLAEVIRVYEQLQKQYEQALDQLKKKETP